MPVPLLPPFAPDFDSPDAHVESYNPQEHEELSCEELIGLFEEENMNYIFELRAQQATLNVSKPSQRGGKQ